jgi:hypothetical protein
LNPREREAIELRAQKLVGWFEWLEAREARYIDLISRDERHLWCKRRRVTGEDARASGFDDRPDERPCEHRPEWQHGKLCLACDNTGWRLATDKERADGMAVDRYAADVVPGAVRVIESTSSRRAREGERIDSIIAGLKRDARIRAGAEVVEDPALRAFRLGAGRQPHFLPKLMGGLQIIRELRPSLTEAPGALTPRTDANDRLCVALAIVIGRVYGGRIERAPNAADREAA